uniref:3-deoxy-D-manno-octulosonate 8-phosphate phosphatase KdsC n=1 Tax=viral metagenome TaxID=1070528 RepID=A0A6C0E8I2_9ZZZZ
MDNNKNIVACVTLENSHFIDFSSIPSIFKILQSISCINQIYVYCSYDQIKNYVGVSNNIKYLELFDKLTGIFLYQNFAEIVHADIYIFIELITPSLTSDNILKGLNSILLLNFDSSFTVRQCQNHESISSTDIVLSKTRGFNMYTREALLLKLKEHNKLTYSPIILNNLEIIQDPISNLNKNLDNIKLIIFDFDGCFSDGSINLDYKGRVIKNYYTLDADAVVKTINKNYKIGIISGNCLNFFKKKAKQWKLSFLHGNVKSKLADVTCICNDMKISIDNVAFFGDGLNDIFALKEVGFSGCPNNAHQEVKKIVNYISPLDGGKGAISDFLSLFP